MTAPLHSAVLLVGGRSSRMGSDKAFLDWHGQPLWRHQQQTLRRTHPDRIYLSVSQANASRFSGEELLVDDVADAGPLAGLCTALRAMETPLLLVLAVDLPFVSAATLDLLLEPCTEGCGCVPVLADQRQPTAAVYPRELQALAERRLRARRLAVQELVVEAEAAGYMRRWTVPDALAPQFQNLNRPSDLPSSA